MKKALALGLAVIMVFTLAGCSGSKKAATSSSNGPVHLTYWLFNNIQEAYYTFGEQQYNKAHPDAPVTLTPEVYPTADETNKLQIALQSGTGAPDICDININAFSNFVKGDIQLVDLSDIVKPVLPYAVKSRFEIYAKNGKYYGVPTHVGATVVYWNTEITDKAGVNIDKIETWDQYEAAGKQILSTCGVPMTIVETTGPRPLWPMTVQQGGDFLNKDGSPALNSQTNVSTLALLKQWCDEKIAVPCPGGSTAVQDFWTFMDHGGCASLIMPCWYISRFLDYMPT